VYEPHIAPRLELWATEFLEHRRARRTQQQEPIAVPVSIPLQRRRGDNRSEHSSSDSESDSGPDLRENDSHSKDLRQPSDSFTTTARVTGFDSNEVNEWRSEVGQSQLSNNLRHRTNVHAMDEVRVFFFF